jgi:hypothetical protein
MHAIQELHATSTCLALSNTTSALTSQQCQYLYCCTRNACKLSTLSCAGYSTYLEVLSAEVKEFMES